jgi:hypothetical protein
MRFPARMTFFVSLVAFASATPSLAQQYYAPATESAPSYAPSANIPPANVPPAVAPPAPQFNAPVYQSPNYYPQTYYPSQNYPQTYYNRN